MNTITNIIAIATTRFAWTFANEKKRWPSKPQIDSFVVGMLTAHRVADWKLVKSSVLKQYSDWKAGIEAKQAAAEKVRPVHASVQHCKEIAEQAAIWKSRQPEGMCDETFASLCAEQVDELVEDLLRQICPNLPTEHRNAERERVLATARQEYAKLVK